MLLTADPTPASTMAVAASSPLVFGDAPMGAVPTAPPACALPPPPPPVLLDGAAAAATAGTDGWAAALIPSLPPLGPVGVGCASAPGGPVRLVDTPAEANGGHLIAAGEVGQQPQGMLQPGCCRCDPTQDRSDASCVPCAAFTQRQSDMGKVYRRRNRDKLAGKPLRPLPPRSPLPPGRETCTAHQRHKEKSRRNTRNSRARNKPKRPKGPPGGRGGNDGCDGGQHVR